MIKLTATALIHYISPVLQVSENFQKRELILNDSWERDGKTYQNFVIIEFTGDKMALLDGYTPGQRVSIEAIINGREYQGRYFNTIKGMGIVPYQPQQPPVSTSGQHTTPPLPGGYPPQQQSPQAPGYPQRPAYPQQSGYPHQDGYANQPAAPMPGMPQGGNLGPAGLPFR